MWWLCGVAGITSRSYKIADVAASHHWLDYHYYVEVGPEKIFFLEVFLVPIYFVDFVDLVKDNNCFLDKSERGAEEANSQEISRAAKSRTRRIIQRKEIIHHNGPHQAIHFNKGPHSHLHPVPPIHPLSPSPSKPCRNTLFRPLPLPSHSSLPPEGGGEGVHRNRRVTSCQNKKLGKNEARTPLLTSSWWMPARTHVFG